MGAKVGPLLILGIIVLLAWANVAILRRFRSRTADWGWWAAIFTSWAVGTIIGVWGGFFFEYQASSRPRISGAPVPAAFFHLEGPPGNQQWIDFITPAPLLLAGVNVLLMPSLLACPKGIVFLLFAKNPGSVRGKNEAGKSVGP
jgi:hypothetical protein